MTRLLLLIGLMFLLTLSTRAQDGTTNQSRPLKLNLDSLRRVNQMRGAGVAGSGSIYGNMSPDSSQYHALIICNQKYNDTEWRELVWPIQDGTKLREVLTKRYTFQPANVRMLENPTRSELYAAIRQYQRTLNRRDNLLVFYAGHGSYDVDLNEGYWIPRDGEKENSANWFPNSDLKRLLSVIQTQHTLVITDACFGGTLSGLRGDDPATVKTRQLVNWDDQLPDHMLRSRYGLRSRRVMTSGALEQVPDKSLFLESLLWTLQNSTIRYMAAEQLFDQTKRAISQQTPLYTVIPDCGNQAGSDFIFSLR